MASDWLVVVLPANQKPSWKMTMEFAAILIEKLFNNINQVISSHSFMGYQLLHILHMLMMTYGLYIYQPQLLSKEFASAYA